MGNAARSGLFAQRLEAAIAAVVRKVVRVPVAELPVSVRNQMARNERKLSLCSHSMSDDMKEELLAVFNSDWSLPVGRTSTLSHYCAPGCCERDEHTKAKAKQILMTLSGKFFSPPLLYRWKHWEPGMEYCFLNAILHSLLQHLWQCCLSDKFDDPDGLDGWQELAEIDMDSADLNPALVQKVRMGKVMKLISEPDFLVPGHSCSNSDIFPDLHSIAIPQLPIPTPHSAYCFH